MLDDLTCPVCMRAFRSKKGCASHLSTARSCAWYRKGKLAELESLDWDGEGGDVQIMDDQGGDVIGSEEFEEVHDTEDQDPEDIMDDVEDEEDLFDFIPMPSLQTAVGEQGPGPSTMAAATTRLLKRRMLDDNDNEHIEDFFEGAGKVIHMKENVHERWRRLFRKEKDIDGDQLMGEETTGEEAFYPFASELDWQVANWVVKEGPGNNAFDRFLSIPGVSFVSQSSIQNIDQVAFTIGTGETWAFLRKYTHATQNRG